MGIRDSTCRLFLQFLVNNLCNVNSTLNETYKIFQLIQLKQETLRFVSIAMTCSTFSFTLKTLMFLEAHIQSTQISMMELLL